MKICFPGQINFQPNAESNYKSMPLLIGAAKNLHVRTMERLQLQNDKDGIFLISLNEKYAPIKVSENDRLDIFGKVLGKSEASAITGHC